MTRFDSSASRRRLQRLGALALLLLAPACSDYLDTSPPDELPDDRAITTAAGARAALAGAYNAMQSLSYYGGDYVIFNDLYSDNGVHNGTFSSYADAGQHALRADNGVVEGNWDAIYDAIKRANILIQKVPALNDLSATEKDQILGEAYLLRALHYHNLVRIWGDVPLITTPVTDPDQAASATRTPAVTIYAQVLADLTEAENRITGGGDGHATLGAAKALLARVYLYQGDYTNALAKTDEVEGLGYALAPVFADLFDADGINTPEDIFRLTFTAEQYTNIGYYWNNSANGGRHEIGPTQSLIDTFEPGDLRKPRTIRGTVEGRASGAKWPTSVGAEDFHVIRFGEVLLIKAESEARLNQLGNAVDTYNRIRARAGLPPHVLGVDVTTQGNVLAAIDHERRVELAEEGDRFPDLVRTGQAEVVMGIQPFQTVFPIPLAEITVAPGVTQNPGY